MEPLHSKDTGKWRKLKIDVCNANSSDLWSPSPARLIAANKAADNAPSPQAHRAPGAVLAAVMALHIEELQTYPMDFVCNTATSRGHKTSSESSALLSRLGNPHSQ